ncbi:FkbM family methyltransferase [Pedobacter riviphilus]|uniref:FkbM family methyltransferase n=1 Tax=Pedobacter riviphilus TaxID=2766984 RepID=A0ABX6TI61_9SPHI|nr:MULTISPECIES: FkbM family methyltransferase [Pedobacter]NII81001.1 FkbM family methyltransferase [Pedobacter sp. SG908]NMN35016.1 FkbM family methyltransferase [Pedobacter sp. SG918]QNR84992.1 FkbM family methyltransferase [Pedobacter riviphilus]
MSSIKNIASKIVTTLFPRLSYGVRAYSSEGEDMILKRIFDKKQHGVYVDVGAHHPFRVSNTYLLYKQNWTGINIDPMPGSMAVFNRHRPKDINLEMGVSAVKQQLTYFIFNEPALNTFSPEKVKEYSQAARYHVIAEKKIETWPLADILDEYLAKDTTIDFLTIDAEGLDLEVLRSNNWNKYKPEYVLAESPPFEVFQPESSELYQFMQQIGYSLFAKTYYTYIFKNMHT